MAGTTFACESCGRTHRTEEAVEKCRTRLEKQAAVQEKRRAEAERRLLNSQAVPWWEYVVQGRREGLRWDQVSSFIKKNYPKGTPNDLWSLALAYAEDLNWPVPNEVTAQALLEKYALGEYVTFHPMSLSIVRDSIAAQGGLIVEKLNVQDEGQDEEQD